MQHKAEQEPRRRVALYSHDTQGLGHVRRNISIASALVAAHPDTDVLLLTGAPEATCLPLPPNTDVVTLPSIFKDLTSHYSPRVLGLSLEELLRLREQIVTAAVTAFQPGLFIVDKAARGVHGELDLALNALRRSRTKVVLGLRDVLDSPGVTVREWQTERTIETVRDLYDEVWVYGDPAVFDAATAYRWPWPVRTKVAYTGYLADRRSYGPAVGGLSHGQPTDVAPPQAPYVLCLVGGGQDGAALADAFAGCTLPDGHQGVLITGPYMAPEQRSQLTKAARSRPDLTVHGFTSRAHEFIDSAAAAVSMAGYNSVCELLAAGCPTLLVPRVAPRMEQALRAEALSQLGWVDTLWPQEFAAERIGGWLATAVNGWQRAHRPISLDGLARVPELADALLEDRSPEVKAHAAV